MTVLINRGGVFVVVNLPMFIKLIDSLVEEVEKVFIYMSCAKTLSNDMFKTMTLEH